MPHAVHEHVRVFGFQWPGAPSVDVVIHALELVGKGLGWHPVTPQQFADVVDLTGAHSRQVHLHQRLLDAGLPPAVAFDDRGFEDRALEFRHPELEPARLCRERAFVVAGPVRLAPLLAFVSGGPGDLVGLGVEHGVEDLGHLLGDQPVEFGLEQVLVDLYDVAVGHGCASCFPIAILCLATENRTQDAGHARFNISTKNKTESAQEFGRYHASYELLPAGSVLPHALRHADDLAVALRVDADGDEDADVLHASAPGALVPHAVHEHVRVFGFQWPGAPSVDVVIHALELVGKGLGWHPVTPQQFADVVDLTGAHSRQVHLHQRLLDAGLPPAVAFDDRGFEDRALEFRHPELEPARLCRERAFVVAGPVRLAPLLAFVSGGPGDLVGLGVEHGVEDLGHLLGDQPVEFGLEQVLVDLYDVAVGHGCASCFPIAILCLATENRTQDAGHARFNISTKNKTESAQEFGRYLSLDLS